MVASRKLTRRAWLGLGLAGSAALAAGGTLRWLTGGYVRPPGTHPIGLSAKELCVAHALCEALLPGGDGLPAAVDLGVPQALDAQVWAADPGAADDLRAALQLIEHAPPLVGAAGRLTRLPPAERLRAFEAMLRSRWSVLARSASGWRQLVHLVYHAEPLVWAGLGYEGPWVPEPRPPACALRYAELLARARGGAA